MNNASVGLLRLFAQAYGECPYGADTYGNCGAGSLATTGSNMTFILIASLVAITVSVLLFIRIRKNSKKHYVSEN